MAKWTCGDCGTRWPMKVTRCKNTEADDRVTQLRAELSRARHRDDEYARAQAEAHVRIENYERLLNSTRNDLIRKAQLRSEESAAALGLAGAILDVLVREQQ